MMAKFLTPLRVQQLDDSSNDGRGTWQLISLLGYQSDLVGDTIAVPPGFITDFASVPRIPIAFFLTGNAAQSAAVIHDWLYMTHQTTKEVADAIFREASIVAGVPLWRAWLMWAGVRIGGWNAWNRDGQPQDPLIESIVRTADFLPSPQPSYSEYSSGS